MFKYATMVAMSCMATTYPSAHAAVIAEFNFFNYSGDLYGQPFSSNYRVMQTFVPTADGSITSVEVTIDQVVRSTSANLTAKIYEVTTLPVDGYQPTGSPLATGSLASNDPQFNTFLITWKNIAMSPAVLSAGTTYALVVDGGFGNQDYEWYSIMADNLYAGGNLAVDGGSGVFTQQIFDVPFRINAQVVPETTSAMLWLASAGVMVSRRRRIG